MKMHLKPVEGALNTDDPAADNSAKRNIAGSSVFREQARGSVITYKT